MDVAKKVGYKAAQSRNNTEKKGDVLLQSHSTNE